MDREYLIGQYHKDGYVVVPSLFSSDEVEFIRGHYMALNAAGHGFSGDDPLLLGDDDPLKAYPRIIHPHRFDRFSLDWLLDERLREWTTALLGAEPYAAQTMFYFKPPISPRSSPAPRSDATTCAPRYLPGRLDGGR